MQGTQHPETPVELGHPDFFADLDHPDGIDHIPLSAIFPAEHEISMFESLDIVTAEKKLKEAKKNLENLEHTYYENDCPELLRKKSAFELVGSVAAWVQVFMPLAPDDKEYKYLEVAVNIISKVASETANKMGESEAYANCQQCNKDVALARDRVLAAKERYDAEVKKMFGTYSLHVQRKKESETRIRDWKNYAYKLEAYCHQLDPSKPRPSAPVYAFKATPVPAERVMRLGAQMMQQAVASMP